jgi:hypothetical protein
VVDVPYRIKVWNVKQDEYDMVSRADISATVDFATHSVPFVECLHTGGLIHPRQEARHCELLADYKKLCEKINNNRVQQSFDVIDRKYKANLAELEPYSGKVPNVAKQMYPSSLRKHMFFDDKKLVRLLAEHDKLTDEFYVVAKKYKKEKKLSSLMDERDKVTKNIVLSPVTAVIASGIREGYADRGLDFLFCYPDGAQEIGCYRF